MRKITREMIKEYELMNLGYDFMGYTFNKPNELSFHHLIVPKRDCQKYGLGDGYLKWNGAILKQNTSHVYLHQIERVDRDMFIEISKILRDENELGRIDLQHLRAIRDVLTCFEREHGSDLTTKGKLLVKERYITERIKL